MYRKFPLGLIFLVCGISAYAQYPNPNAILPAPSVHERFANFLAGDGFKSTLLLENFRQDVPITVNPALVLSQGEVPLDSVTLAPHSTATVDISGFLSTHNYSDKQGTAVVRYTFNSYGPVGAVVESVDEAHELYLNSYAASPEEYWSGTTYDAVVWTPQRAAQGFVSIINTAAEARTVTATFLTNGHSEVHPLKITSHQTQILPIDDLLARSGQTGAGIHIEFQNPGDILVEGQLFNKQTRFTKHIHFINKSLQFPTGTLKTHFLLLGQQPAGDNYPSNVSFQSVATVRNIDTQPVQVTPTVKFLRNGSVQTVTLTPLNLGIGESQTIDLGAEQQAGRLPGDLHQGSLQLVPNGDKISIVAELFNYYVDSGSYVYVVGPSLASYPSRATNSIWKIDGTFQTTIMAENTLTQDDRVTLKLFSSQGVYSKTFPVAAGGLLKVNVRDLQNVPDDKGNLLVDNYGVLSIAGSQTTSRFTYDKVIHSADESDYVGLPPNGCDYITALGLYVDTTNGANPYPIMMAQFWSISGEIDVVVGNAGSNDSTLAQIGYNSATSDNIVTFNAPDDGQTHSATVSVPQVYSIGCDACSSVSAYVYPILFSIERAYTRFITGTYTPDPGPPPFRYYTISPWCTQNTTPPDWTGAGLYWVTSDPPQVPTDVVDGKTICMRIGNSGHWTCAPAGVFTGGSWWMPWPQGFCSHNP